MLREIIQFFLLRKFSIYLMAVVLMSLRIKVLDILKYEYATCKEDGGAFTENVDYAYTHSGILH